MGILYRQMKYLTKLILSMILVLVLLSTNPSIIYIKDTSGDPLPVRIIGGDPLPQPDNSTPIYLQEENITVVANATTLAIYEVGVIASYTLKNNGTKSITQTIVLPFTKRHPQELLLSVDGKEIDYSWTVYDIYEVAEFNIDFEGHESRTLTAVYNSVISIRDTTFLYYYISITGREWNHPIYRANFSIYIEDDFCKEGPVSENFDYFVIRENDRVIAKVDFINWVPEYDIDIRWGSIRQPQAYITLSKSEVCVNEVVILNASESFDSIGNITEYFFDFGDDTNSNWVELTFIEHRYANAGFYDVRVRVIDDDGEISDWSNVQTIEVREISDDFWLGHHSVILIGSMLVLLILIVGATWVLKRRKRGNKT